MVVVVSGTHASGKTSLVEGFAAAHPQFRVLLDPFETLDEYRTDANASIFYQQLEVSAARLLHCGEPVIAERGPLDFLAYLDALEQLERPTRSRNEFHRGVELCVEAMAGVDLLVLLALNSVDRIDVPEDEDPELRKAMDEALPTLAGDEALTGGAEVIEVARTPKARLARLERAGRVPPGLTARRQYLGALDLLGLPARAASYRRVSGCVTPPPADSSSICLASRCSRGGALRARFPFTGTAAGSSTR